MPSLHQPVDVAASRRPPTPFAVVTRSQRAEPITQPRLVARCRAMEAEALASPPSLAAVLLQDGRHLTPATLRSYTTLAARGTDVVMYGRGLRAWLAPGVRGVAIGDDDPLGDVWAVVLAGSASPVVLAALDLFAEGSTEAERSFQVAVSRDSAVVRDCLRVLGLSEPLPADPLVPVTERPVSGAARPGTPRS